MPEVVAVDVNFSSFNLFGLYDISFCSSVISPSSEISVTSNVSVLEFIPYPIGASISVNSIILPTFTLIPDISSPLFIVISFLITVLSGFVTFKLYFAPTNSSSSLFCFLKSKDKFPTSS